MGGFMSEFMKKQAERMLDEYELPREVLSSIKLLSDRYVAGGGSASDFYTDLFPVLNYVPRKILAEKVRLYFPGLYDETDQFAPLRTRTHWTK
jgi:hypothetical protein